MKKQKRYLFIGAILLSLTLSGCGTELYELTSEEESLIVHYAAYYVAKHNIQQKDGISAVVDPDTITVEDDTTEAVEDSTELETVIGEDANSPSGEGEQDVEDAGTSLAEIIGHGTDLSVVYSGSYTADNYIEGSAYSVDAAKGKTFFVMKFSITNTTDEDVEVDNASINPIFKLVSESVSVKSEVTFLTTDFSTYQGTIPAGKTVETILLFEVSESVADTITAPSLQISVDNEIKSIKL